MESEHVITVNDGEFEAKVEKTNCPAWWIFGRRGAVPARPSALLLKNWLKNLPVKCRSPR